eukprot:Lithocolla_globosa_v1_NODE_1598_length_2457_cov_74.169858.p2 type:complete len:112 gc:universal NODE_1598_length_2457_cov_74.169858:540-205(-)
MVRERHIVQPICDSYPSRLIWFFIEIEILKSAQIETQLGFQSLSNTYFQKFLSFEMTSDLKRASARPEMITFSNLCEETGSITFKSTNLGIFPPFPTTKEVTNKWRKLVLY